LIQKSSKPLKFVGMILQNYLIARLKVTEAKKELKNILIEMNLRKLLTTDWITILGEKLNDKSRELGHNTKTKIHKPTSTELLNKNYKSKFKRKKRLSY
jgi:hypothetical protein